MKLQGDYVFEASLDEVWTALLDPIVLAAVMPGCEKLDLVDGQYVGELNIKVGPVQGKFSGKVDLKDIVDHKSYTMNVDGRGAPGFVKATAAVVLEAEGAKTRIRYDADAQVGGKIASVGQRLLEASSRAITKQSLEGLNDNIKLRAAHAQAVAAANAAPAQPAATAAVASTATPDAPAEEPAVAISAVTENAPAAAESPAVVDAKSPPLAGADAAPAPVAVDADAANVKTLKTTPPPPPVPAKAAAPPMPLVLKKADTNALAASIAKEVTRSLLPRPVVLGLGAVAVLVAIWLVFYR